MRKIIRTVKTTVNPTCIAFGMTDYDNLCKFMMWGQGDKSDTEKHIFEVTVKVVQVSK